MPHTTLTDNESSRRANRWSVQRETASTRGSSLPWSARFSVIKRSTRLNTPNLEYRAAYCRSVKLRLGVLRRQGADKHHRNIGIDIRFKREHQLDLLWELPRFPHQKVTAALLAMITMRHRIMVSRRLSWCVLGASVAETSVRMDRLKSTLHRSISSRIPMTLTRSVCMSVMPAATENAVEQHHGKH